MYKKIKPVRWWLMVAIILGVGSATSSGCFFDDHGHGHDHHDHDDHWDRR